MINRRTFVRSIPALGVVGMTGQKEESESFEGIVENSKNCNGYCIKSDAKISHSYAAKRLMKRVWGPKRAGQRFNVTVHERGLDVRFVD